MCPYYATELLPGSSFQIRDYISQSSSIYFTGALLLMGQYEQKGYASIPGQGI